MKANLKGGYVLIDLASDTIYNDLVEVVNNNKLVVVYDSSQDMNPIMIDTITIDGNNDVILTKGGLTITVEPDNVSIGGQIQPSELHLYQVNILGEIGGSAVEFIMNIYSTKNLPIGNISATDIETINELNLYQETFMRDNNNQVKTIATYEDLFIDNNALEFNFYDDEGESSFNTGSTVVNIAKIF